jgi:3',5'-cyclic-AMP phosphodiesterase
VIRIAHLSDTHLNGTADRRTRLIAGLSKAQGAGAKHLLLTGDLTTSGRPEEYYELARVLRTHWVGSSTVIAGNHDSSQFDSMFGAPSLIDLGDAFVMPLDTRYGKRALLFRALGRVGLEQLSSVERLASSTTKPVVVAMHHGPQSHPLQWLDGLVDRRRMLGLLESHPHMHVCCGHDHRNLDVGRIHVAGSAAHHPDPLRLYDVVEGRFFPSYRSIEPGKYMTLGAVKPCS